MEGSRSPARTVTTYQIVVKGPIVLTSLDLYISISNPNPSPNLSPNPNPTQVVRNCVMATIPRLAEFAPQHFARFYLANCMQVRALLSFAVRICFVSIPCESYRNFQWEIMGRIETRPRKKCWSDYQIWKGWYSDEVRRGGREIHHGEH